MWLCQFKVSKINTTNFLILTSRFSRPIEKGYTGKLSVKFRNQTAIRTDERIRFMDEIISGIHAIKLYAWEKPFTKLISLARQLELKVVKKNSYVRALYMTFALTTTRMAVFVALISIIFIGDKQDITASKVFVIASYFSVIAQTMSQMFVRGIAEIAEGLVAVNRIQEFLESEEKQKSSRSILNTRNNNASSASVNKMSEVRTQALNFVKKETHLNAHTFFHRYSIEHP